MSDHIQDIVIPILRNLQQDVSELGKDVSELKADMGMVKESIRRIDARITTMDHYMGGFTRKAAGRTTSWLT